jgi:hypothetical protein
MGQELERAIQYRAKAEDLLQQSHGHTDKRHRGVLLDLAVTYHRLAKQIEDFHWLNAGRSSKANDG